MVNVIQNDGMLCVYTNTGSVAELSEISQDSAKDYNTEWKATLPTNSPVYYFNRLVSRKKGDGSILMKELSKALDDAKISVILEVNPYGDMGLNDLIGFYEKYGFNLLKVDTEQTGALIMERVV
jgi:hypothetical protein